MPSEAYMELCSRLMVPDSANLARIWEMLCDPTDARLLLAMPGTADELAERTGLSPEEVKRRLENLFVKGVVFESVKPHGTVYRMPRHPIQFHDASVQWPDADRAFYEAWKAFMEQDFPAMLLMVLSSGMPAFMRVVPSSGTLEGAEGTLAHEDIERMIGQAKDLAVCRCPCRLTERNCDSTVEVCIQIDKGARYNIKRGTGRRIDREEALRILRNSEEAGLVHFTDNRAGLGSFVCNCCTCCCQMLRPYMQSPELAGVLAPSRYRAEVDTGMCTLDGACVDICPVGAVSIEQEQDAASVDAEVCIGCGLCVTACGFDAMTLREIRPPDFIPA